MVSTGFLKIYQSMLQKKQPFVLPRGHFIFL